jgi:FlaA1/EpsC-like NDP-sugar epimerase
MFNDKNIFITGGTASFGKHFIRRILKDYKPNKIVVFSRDELKQFEMQDEFNSAYQTVLVHLLKKRRFYLAYNLLKSFCFQFSL